MSGLNAFLSQNAIKAENEKHIISERFLDEEGKAIPWEIRALSERENQALRKSFTTKTRVKGVVVTETDYEGYLAKLITESVVFPNLKDKELQESYGVLGAESLAKTMLIGGEYDELLKKVQLVNGFNIEDEKIIEEAKN